MAEDNSKAGAGHASAMFRLGLRELRGSLYAESNVAQHPEYGLYGTRTPGEVAESRRGDDRNMDEEPAHDSALADRLGQANDREAEREEMAKDQERHIEIDRD